MTNVLVTGGAGYLGRHVVTKLVEMGYTVQIMSRRSQPVHLASGTQWVQADLATGQGITEAVSGIDVVVHAATDPTHPKQVDVHGTQMLVENARNAGVAHIVYISIVGVDRIPFSYYQNKMLAEELIKSANISWSILRATQFHAFVDILLQAMTKPPLVAIVPTDFKAQTIDEREVAFHLCKMVDERSADCVSDLVGPQVMTLGEMAAIWMKQKGMRRVKIPLWLPGKVAQGFHKGDNTRPEELLHGNTTWSQWLQRQYPREMEGREEHVSAN